jgi:hypothetical protein
MKRIGSLRVCLLIAIGACGPTAQDDDDGGGDDGPGGVDANPNGDPDAGACVAEGFQAVEATRPVDILWVIDNSGSMDDEEARVQNNMNGFAQSIAASGVDYHVIVITNTGHITVPPPLGGSPELLQVNQQIESHDALEWTVATYPMYQSFLRDGSIKHIVAVTDDESDWSQGTFEAQLAALTAPGFGTDWKFHAVVAEDPPWDFSSHCFGLAADIGATYIDLQQDHGGLFFSLCDTDWSPLFSTLSQTVVQDLGLPCTYDIPDPPNGQTLDPTRVNFIYTPTSGQPITIPNVGDISGCNGGDGWYYDDPINPTQIIVCPNTCTTLEGDATGQVSVEIGCATVID